ncbi:MAG: hypothetical protein ACLFV5_05240 [Anaerolineales bacterium]
MNRSFRRGLLAGILAPLFFLAGIAFWVYQATGKIPCPTQRLEEGGISLRLVEPNRVLGYWEKWQEELLPVLDRLCILIEAVKGSPLHG